MKLIIKSTVFITTSSFILLFLAGCFGTTLTAGAGRFQSPAGILIIKDENLGVATNQSGAQVKNNELTLTIFKKDNNAFTEDEFNKIMSQQFSLEDNKGNKYQLAYSGLIDDNFLLMIGFIVPDSASGFRLKYQNSNPIILRN